MSFRVRSISLENVAGVDLVLHIIEARVVAVGDDGIRLFLELVQVVDHHGAEEGRAVLKGGLIDNHLGALGLHALHHALDGRLAEVVGV